MEAKRAKTGLTPEERQLYEHNLSKFKGIWERFSTQIDERDAIQKKTFTKWVNKHLKKANRHVDDLFTDLQDGLNLISLLEVLSGEHLHREKGRMRFHALQNVELVLNFLRYKKIKLVNIRPEDIVDGNPKLTLGLIWTIILHFQISDIVLSQREENVSPKEVLLKWAKKSTARYPEVRVSDFTSSWRDGLAFNALIHRNRPDLFEWRTVKTKTVRDRLEHAFYNAEKVGVTRLLDPEDVDTHEIDEKSIITYISSLYDVFPEPPAKHPLFDNESQTLTQEYREVASSLHLWIRENTSIFSERTLPATLNDLVKASQESTRFKTYELPSKQPERQRLTHLYTELQKIYESTGQVDIEPELHIDVLDRNYQKLLSIHQERDQQLQDEIKKFERLDRLADRLSRDCKRVDSRLDDVETRVSEESKRLERLHPLDAKRNAESLESEMRSIEETINSLFQDLNILKTVGHSASSSLDRKVNKLHQKWVALRSSLHSKLIARLASVSFPVVEERTVTRQTRTVLETRLVDTNHHFRSLQQAIEWCKAKIKLINESELGNDLAGVKIELAHHEREHKEIDRFKTTVEQCAAAKSQFTGEEHALYLQHLNNLHKVYSELLTTSNKRMSDLESLLDYLQSLQNQLQWLSDKEAVEVARDWSDPNINLMSVQHYHDSLMSELEKREVSVRSVLERGNSLVLQNHPAGKTISRWTELLKEAWSRLLQFSLACEIHTEATRKYQEYTKDLREAEAWLQSRDELLNTVYSASEFSLDEGERLLKGMQEMREELNKKAPLFAELTARAAKIPPIRQRRLPVTRPIQVTAVCNYTSDKVYIEKEDTWLLHDNSALTQWRVSSLSSRGEDTNVPGVVFFIPPPGKELLESAERLNRAFESTTQLWQKKHMRLRQNMIFATIRVVRSWDLAQFISMGADQRNAIRRALNEDADKLLSEGDPSDPQLRRLRREMDEVNRLFEELERRARQEDEQKAALREFTETSNRIQLSLDEYERTLNSRILNSIARDPHTLERLILQHHDFEKDLKSFTPEIENIQTLYNALARKSHQHTLKVESLLQQWNTIWNYSHLYTERLKCVEIVLASLDEARNVVSELEIKLASFGELPSELESLKELQDDLVRLQNAIAARQPVVDQLIDDATNTRRVVVRSRDRTSEREHGDLDRLDEDVNSVTRRWNDLCANLVDRLRSCDAAGQLLDNFGQSYQTEIKFIDESYKQLNDLPPVSHAKHHIEPTKVLFTSIVERTQPLEQVNIDGGRFIREAKIYGVTLRRYADEVTKLNPSFERPEYESVQISNVEEKLDNINQRFLTLVTVMQDRIRQMAALTGEEDLQEFVRTMKPAQLRTFRTVFSIAETTKEITNRWLPDEADMGNQINGRETSTSDLLSLKGIKDPSTGRILSVSEAIRERILDVRNGTVRLPSGESIPLASAAEYVDPVIIKKLLSHHSGSTLLEKIQNEIFSAENPVSLTDFIYWRLYSDHKILDRNSGEFISLEDAIKNNILYPFTPEIYTQNKKITLQDGLIYGFDTENVEKPLSLKECYDLNMLKDDFINTRFGPLSVQEALNQHILDGDQNTIFDPNTKKYINLKKALQINLIKNNLYDTQSLLKSAESGKFISLKTQSVFNLDFVYYDNEFKSLSWLHNNKVFSNGTFMINNKCTLEDLESLNLIKKDVKNILSQKIGVFSCGKELNAYEAVCLGLLDPPTGLLIHKNKKIGFSEALKVKMITKQGLENLKSILFINLTFKNKVKYEKFDKLIELLSPPEKGFRLKEVIDKELIKNGLFTIPGSDREVSLEECLKLGIIDNTSASILYKNKEYSLKKALDKRIIRNNLIDDKSLEENIKMKKVIFDVDFSRGLYIDQSGPITLLKAIEKGYLDKNFVVVKDTKKRKFLKFMEAYNKGVVDERGNVLSDRLYNLKESVENNLAYFDQISLIDAVEYGLYNPTTGLITDPFSDQIGLNRPRLDLSAAFATGLVSTTTTLFRDKNDIVNIPSAIQSGLLDTMDGKYKTEDGPIDLFKANNKGYLVRSQSRQAMEEKYKLCDDSLRQLLEWMSEVEDRLSRQEPASENLDGIRDQLNHLKLIKEELESQQRIVQSCLDDVRNVITNGQEYLSRDELMTLERNAKSLKTRYDRSNTTCDRLLRRLQSAYEELSKFRTEANTFADWLGKTKRVLNEKEKNLKNDNVTELLNDIISHQADLRFITMASQKFSDESKEFLNNVNEYRNTLASRPGLVEPYPSELKKFVAELTREYKELSSRIKDLSDKISGLGGRQREYKLALERVRTWMQNAEPRANKILSEPLAADPHSLDEQLARAKSINAEFQGQGRLFDHLKQSLELLLRSIEGQASRSEMHELAQPVEELSSKYEMISNSIAKRIENLDNALAQSQGVEQSLENVVSWLSNAENNIKSLTRPASLNKARLEEQVRSVRGPLTEIVAYRGTIENVVVLARNLVSSSTNPRLATRIETKVKDVLSRYEKLLERSTKLSENFNEVTAALDEFTQHANEIETWLQESMDGLSVGGAGAVDVVSVERDAKREPIERVLREGRNLLARKDVTDTSQIRDRMKNIETQWRDLNMLLDEKVRLSKMRAEQSLAYDKLRDHIVAWLNSFEGKIARLEPVALQMELIKKQTEDLKPLVKEHREFAPTIDRLFDLGTSLESVERPESPTRRRSSVSPVKRLSSIGRKSSQEMTSPTPTKIYVTSPMSPVSSGFGSRRSSQEVYHGEDYTGVQQEVAELNNRYSSLGVKLAERSAELDSVREELRKSLENLRSLDTFLERTARSMPREGLCANREEADKTNKLVKSLLEEMYEKQSLLDSTKNTINELLKRKNGADLKKQLDDVCAKWKNLYDACKQRIEILDSLKDFYDTHDHLSTWLGAKERMIGALGPISSDPRMVQSQVEQVQVLREELRAMRPQLSHLEIITGTLVQKTKWTPLEAKLKNISDRWTSLAQKLDERASNLGAAVDSSREFDSGLNRLRETLNNISDQIDAAANEKDHEQHLRKIQSCERQLEGARQLLAEAEAAGEELCKVLTDAASRAEIQAKLAAVNKQYNALQAKLDRRKAEIENFLKDAREFDATLAKTSGWINDELGSLSDRLLISAHKDILQQQYDFHEPIYKDVINREHQVVMLFDKASSSKRNLENLRSAWDKLKKEISDRHARLSTSLQHCKKFYTNLDTFVPWLATSEARLESLRPESFSRRDLDKHLRDLTSFRNDIWKKSGEFEHLRSTGETFVASCDIDKDIVLQEIASAKNRWDRLNNDLLLKTSTLEELGRRLADASDRLRSLTHSVQRCEDRLGSHDSISTQSDPATIARLNALRDEVQSLRKPHEQLRGLCSELDDQVSEVSNGRTSGLKDEVDGLADRLDDLSSRLQDRCDRAQLAAKAAQNYYDKVKNLTVDLTNLEDEFHQMKPPGRDLKVLKAQQDELGMFNNKLNRAGDEVSTIQALSESLDSEGARQQAENIAKRLSSLESASRRREESLENALDKLYDFLNKAKTADELLNRALDDYKKLKPVGSEPDTIRSQQDESASLRANIVDPAGSAVESALSSGQILVQTASPGVNTAQVERECDRISQKWNDLKEKMTDRDKRLNVGLLQSGKFQEALEGLSKWLADMEDLVANQKPPSADFKVVKAQLQEQKFLKKMLLDRQGSINSLFVMGREVASNCGPSEGNAIERQLKNLSDRFEDLNSKADSRMNALEKAMNIARVFQDKITSLSDWLFKTEKKIKDMHTVPTDEEKIQNKIREHESLHSEIMRRKSEFNEVTDIAANLASLVSEDDATLVADQVQEAIDRYSKLVNDSENVSHILESARQKLRHLVVTYQQLQGWMENMESRLARFKVLAVHTEQLYAQMEDLADLSEEISNQQNNVDSTIDSGHELMRSISSDEAIQLKDKLDSLQRRYNDLTTRGAELLKQAQEALPLVQQFHNSHNKLVDWMHSAETTLQNAEPREESIHALEMDIQEFRPVLETVNQLGPQLCAIGPGEGAATIEGLVTRDNRRFDAISEQVQRKAERLQLCKQRSLEVLSDVDSLLEWFREVEAQLREAEPPNGDPQVIRLQLKEHKALNDDIASQKGRVRDVLDTAKKVLRESPQYEDNSVMRDKMVDLRETMDNVWKASGDRLNLLELALGLAQHFETSHSELAAWLDEKTAEAKNLRPSSLRPQALMQDQVVTQRLLQSITEHKPLMDKLNKTGESLIKIVSYEEGVKIQDVLDNDNARYNELRNLLKQRQEALEKALQESSEFADKLEGMLRALSNAADEMNSAEPVSAHPPKIRQQIKENQGLIDDIGKREEAFEAVKKAAGDVIAKSPNDPAVKDIKKKLEKLQQLWKEVNDATKSRNKSLSQALEVAAKFWAALESVMTTLAEIERTLMEQEPPALKPELVRRQGEALGLVKNEIDSAKPRVEDVRKTGQSLMALCGDADKTEVRKNIEDLDSAWDTVTTLFARREENLLDAMERAMEFHETLRALKEFLQDAERRFAALGPLGEDIGTIRNQMKEVKDLKASLDPMMIKVESLNRQAAELTERSTADQAMGLKESLTSVNNRWDELHRGIAERYRQLENALLRLGQFQTALSELLTWIANTEKTLDTEMSVVAVDPHLLEVQLAKLKVLMNDMSAHQNSVDTLNDAGRQIVEENPTDDKTQDRLKDLNKKWKNLITKASEKQSELEEALRQGQRFSAEIQDLLAYLGEVDSVIASSKPVGGLPETASEQLERFMIVYNELEETRPRIESAISHGNDLIRKNPDSSSYTQNNLKTLKSRWDNVISRANDKKIKLEIALKEAVEFHDALQAFVNWLTSAEKTLSSLKPVSRVLETILNQIEDHKNFQKEVGVHRETMLNLDKKGNHLKYFSQKQDVILIKNLLISVQHRWEKVVSKSAERTRSLDHGYKEAKDFHDSWSNLINFLKETDQKLDDIETSNDPVKLRQKLTKHREIQKSLNGKQIIYDATLRQGKNLKEKAPKSDENTLKMMLQELKDMWTSVNNKVLLKQRNLEESLLYCGQVKDALDALLDFLKKANKELADDVVHGDLDTVQGLIERHRSLEQDIQNRRSQIESLERSELLSEQISELSELWKKTNVLCQKKNVKLQSALKMAEELHKNVHNLLEFLSDSESKLRNWELSDDETELRVALQEHERFLDEIKDKERDKNMTIRLAEEILSKAHPDAVNTIKHWISIIQSRWEEITSWSRQKTERLKTHLRSLQDMDSLLEELLAYLGEKESNLISLEHQELPKTTVETNILIEEHQRFMESMAKRTTEIDTVIKAKTIKERKQSKKSGSTQEINEITRRQSLRSSREQLAERRMSRSSGKDYSDPTLPHFGPKFPTKGSKTPEPQFKCARSRLLYDRWRSVWLMSWERQRRLRDHLLHLGELERLANFSWDEWRKRFLRFMNHKKSRLTDLFRKMDKNNDNLIPRDDFVNGIINTKFDTNRPEMGAVADMFDHNSEGYIDWKEFIAALRPDWEERQPSTEAEKIHDEVKRLVMLCTCRQKFRVFQVGEGKYRFGDSQKLRLVRILRSTVMVRVGGGWQALEEFLVKNDPCRVEMLPIPNPFIPEEHEAWCPLSVKRPSKGRTNIELREQFILPEGVSQSMSAFKPKLSTEKKSSSPLPTAGPITKIREKSSKSVPMASSRGTPGSVDSLSDLDSPHTPGYMMPRKSSMRVPSSSTPGSLPGSRSNSRPQSRTNSKPPSRHASNLSLASSDDGTPSRIPRMSVPSRSSSSASGTQRKLTAPGALNGSKSPSGSIIKRTNLTRASSIPTLVNRSSTSKIPIFVGSTDVSHSTSSSGTPSGRTTPKSSR